MGEEAFFSNFEEMFGNGGIEIFADFDEFTKMMEGGDMMGAMFAEMFSGMGKGYRMKGGPKRGRRGVGKQPKFQDPF